MTDDNGKITFYKSEDLQQTVRKVNDLARALWQDTVRDGARDQVPELALLMVDDPDMEDGEYLVMGPDNLFEGATSAEDRFGRLHSLGRWAGRRGHDVDMVFVVSEGWRYEGDEVPEGLLEGEVSTKDLDESVEILFVDGGDESGGRAVLCQQIMRDDDDQPTALTESFTEEGFDGKGEDSFSLVDGFWDGYDTVLN